MSPQKNELDKKNQFPKEPNWVFIPLRMCEALLDLIPELVELDLETHDILISIVSISMLEFQRYLHFEDEILTLSSSREIFIADYKNHEKDLIRLFQAADLAWVLLLRINPQKAEGITQRMKDGKRLLTIRLKPGQIVQLAVDTTLSMLESITYCGWAPADGHGHVHYESFNRDAKPCPYLKNCKTRAIAERMGNIK